MGGQTAKIVDLPPRPRLEVVNLHVYDISPSLTEVNQALFQLMGGGAFHAGVELFGLEWSYRNRQTGGTGVYCHERLKAPGAVHRLSVSMGTTELSEDAFYVFIQRFVKEWPASNYHILRNNCCHFAKAFLERLGCASNFPGWLNTLADTGDNIAQSSLDQAKAIARFDKNLNQFLTQAQMEACPTERNMLGSCCGKQLNDKNPTIVQVVNVHP